METTIKRNTIKSINPATEEVLKEYEVITPAELDNVISKADLAFKIWKNTSFTERAKILNKAADLMMEKQQFLAELITVEMGKRLPKVWMKWHIPPTFTAIMQLMQKSFLQTNKWILLLAMPLSPTSQSGCY